MHQNIRRAADRGTFNHGWLTTHHTFSFAEYYDPRFLGYRKLRVMNEDTVAPGQGFGMHGHKDMEIITLVLDGELSHKDSLGNQRTLKAGEIQVMTAGTGVRHSEFNASSTKPVHFYQVWIEPDAKGRTPAYGEKKLSDTKNEWVLIASPDGRDHSLSINQDVLLYTLALDGETQKRLGADRYGYLQVVKGNLRCNGEKLSAGDGVYLEKSAVFLLKTEQPSQVLFFDLN